MSYPFPIYNVRLNQYMTFTDLYLSKENPNIIPEERIFRLFPILPTEGKSWAWRVHYYGCNKLKSLPEGSIFIRKNIQDAIDLAHSVFAELHPE